MINFVKQIDEENPSNSDKIIMAVSDAEYGTIFTHDDLLDILGLSEKSTEYYNAIYEANDRMKHDTINGNKRLECINKVGYKVLMPGQYIGNANKQHEKGKRAIVRAKDVLEYAPTQNMTRDEKNKHRNILDRLGTSLRLISRQACAITGCIETRNIPIRVNERIVVNSTSEVAATEEPSDTL